MIHHVTREIARSALPECVRFYGLLGAHWGSPRAFVLDPAGHQVELMAHPPE